MYFWTWLVLTKYLPDDYWHTKISFSKRQYIRELIVVCWLAFLNDAIFIKWQDCPSRTACTDLWFTVITWITSSVRLTLLYMRLRKLIEHDRKQDIKINPQNNSEFFFRGSTSHMSWKFYPQFNTFCYKAHIMNSLLLARYIILVFVVKWKGLNLLIENLSQQLSVIGCLV